MLLVTVSVLVYEGVPYNERVRAEMVVDDVRNVVTQRGTTMEVGLLLIGVMAQISNRVKEVIKFRIIFNIATGENGI